MDLAEALLCLVQFQNPDYCRQVNSTEFVAEQQEKEMRHATVNLDFHSNAVGSEPPVMIAGTGPTDWKIE